MLYESLLSPMSRESTYLLTHVLLTYTYVLLVSYLLTYYRPCLERSAVAAAVEAALLPLAPPLLSSTAGTWARGRRAWRRSACRCACCLCAYERSSLRERAFRSEGSGICLSGARPPRLSVIVHKSRGRAVEVQGSRGRAVEVQVGDPNR